MNGLRVLLVGPYPPPYGGIASHLTNLIPGLKQRGVDDVAVVSFGLNDVALQESGATVHRIKSRQRVLQTMVRHARTVSITLSELSHWRLGRRKLLSESVRAASIASIARQHNSNVVSFYQTDESLALLPLRRLWNQRVGIVLTVLGEAYDTPQFFESRKVQVGQLLSAADVRLSSSLHCARSFQKIGLQHPIEAIYYGVDLERFENGEKGKQWRQQRRFEPHDAVALFLGRFTEEMGIDCLLEVIPKLLDANPRLRFVLAGAKGPFSAPANDVSQHFPDRVVILNDVPFDTLPALYAASDIVLAPTRDQHACMGMSIKEAMAASRPVIGSDAGGIPEAIVEGETGFLVPLASDKRVDRRQLTTAIETLTRNPERRAAMGSAARRRAEELFSNEKTVDRILSVFASVQPRS